MTGGFGWLDWGVVAALFLGTTLFGHLMRGRQKSLRDFFLGGRRLPWYAVSASIVSTEISAVTYISVPSIVWAPGGDLTYLQIALIGSFLARLFIAWKLVPAYYEREIFSPYDYMGARRGEGMRRTATAIFTLGGLLGQSARVYQTALVLEILLGDELAWVQSQTGLAPLSSAVVALGLVAVLWTWMGGMATIIWTDAILTLAFLVGIVVMLLSMGMELEGGLGSAFSAAGAAGKLRLLDFDTDPTKAYTFWAAAIASTWGGIGQYGTDQLMVQRVFCCRTPREAQKAMVSSIVVVLVILAVQCVGVALWAYTNEHPLSGRAAELVAEKPDRVLPVVVVEVLRPGLKGLVVGGALAAAIGGLDSILAALAQTTLSALVLPARARRGRVAHSPEAEARWQVRCSRALVCGWGVALCLAAIAVEPLHAHYHSVLNLALSMAAYTGGALLAGFAIAYLPLSIDGSGYRWSAPLSVVAVFALAWHESPTAPWVREACVAVAGLVLALWVLTRLCKDLPRAPGRALMQLAALVVALALILLLERYLVFEGGGVLAFPWYIPIGSLYAFVFGIVLARSPVEVAS